MSKLSLESKQFGERVAKTLLTRGGRRSPQNERHLSGPEIAALAQMCFQAGAAWHSERTVELMKEPGR